MQFCFVDFSIGEANQRDTLELAPACVSVPLSQTGAVPNTGTFGDRLAIIYLTYYFNFHREDKSKLNGNGRGNLRVDDQYLLHRKPRG